MLNSLRADQYQSRASELKATQLVARSQLPANPLRDFFSLRLLAASELRGAFEEVARDFAEEEGDGVVRAEVDLEHLGLGSLQLLRKRRRHELQRRAQVYLAAA